MPIEHSIDIAPCRRVEGRLAVPGDKSISHRALLVGMIADGGVSISGLSPAADVASSRGAVELLGARVIGDHHEVKVKLEGSEPSVRHQDFQVLVSGPGWDALERPGAPIDVGNSGTTIRLLAGIIAASNVEAVLTGDASIRRRPMARVIDPLRAMGAVIEGTDGARAPLMISGRELHGVDHVLPVASAQVKSALIFAGLRATGETIIREPGPSRDHTERMLAHLGVPITKDTHRLIVKSTNVQGGSLTVPGDLSSAAFLLVAAAIMPGSEVTVTDVGLNPTRSGMVELLERYGADVEISDRRDESGEPVGTVTVRAADRRPLTVERELTVRSIDELPLVGVLGAYAEGETVVTDAGELRVKESDRIATLVAGLTAMGVNVEGTSDGFIVRGGPRPSGAVVDSAGDHRIAMALAVAALAADTPTRVTGWDAVGVSYPGFERDVASVAVP